MTPVAVVAAVAAVAVIVAAVVDFYRAHLFMKSDIMDSLLKLDPYEIFTDDH